MLLLYIWVQIGLGNLTTFFKDFENLSHLFHRQKTVNVGSYVDKVIVIPPYQQIAICLGEIFIATPIKPIRLIESLFKNNDKRSDTYNSIWQTHEK